MADKRFIIKGPDDEPLTVWVRRDKRLKKSSRWQRQTDGSVLLRIPFRFPNREIGVLLEQLHTQLVKEASRRRRHAEKATDYALQIRAEHINRRYFGGRVQWNAIRWVSNMEKRLGSCTNGGATDGFIRISDKIRHWPDWVVDYVIAHELTHRLHPNHSADFWHTLEEAYPLTERARGFIQGYFFARGEDVPTD